MTVDLSQWPRVIFERNTLSVVVLQVRFSPVLGLAQPAGVAPFQDKIREDYPRAEVPSTQVAMAFGPLGAMSGQPTMGPWKFLGDRGWIAALATDYVSVETTQYTRYEELRSRAEAVLTVTRDVLGIRDAARIGLRYVNEIRHPEARALSDWRRLLKSDLLGVAGGEAIGPDVIQTLQQIDAELPTGVLTVRHGWRRPGPDDPSASPYVIDLDAHLDVPQDFDVAAILATCDDFNARIGGFFRQSLTEELVTYLGPSNPGE